MTIFNDLSELNSISPKGYNELKSQGLIMLSSIKEELTSEIEDWGDSHPIAVIMTKALTWADYSNNEDSGFNYLVDFIDAKKAVNDELFEKSAARYGSKELKSTAKAYRRFLNQIKAEDFDYNTASTNELLQRQDRWLSWLSAQKESGKIAGFGTWFFSVIFYSILVLREELWRVTELESLCMPTGKEVNAGLRKAKKTGLPAFQEMAETRLISYDADINNSFSKIMIIQSYINQVAKATSCGVVVISAGLYALGAGKFKLN